MPTTYTLDLNAGLTQVLADGTNTYVYGNGRIAQYAGTTPAYFLGDALGSVRQLTNASGAVTLARSYEPFGSTLSSVGSGTTVFQFTGEMRDATGLTYLRTRYLSTYLNQFIQPDPIIGQFTNPQTLNRYSYVTNNPINLIDPSGMISQAEAPDANKIIANLQAAYNVWIFRDWGYWVPSIHRILDNPPPGSWLALCRWQDGAWKTLDELRWASEAVDLAANAMGGPNKFQSAMRSRPVSVIRLDTSGLRGFAIPSPLFTAYADIVLTNYGFGNGEKYVKHAVIHELGHVWDIRTGFRLSTDMATVLKTHRCGFGYHGGACWFDIAAGKEPPPGNPSDPYAGRSQWEDWAEAFATYVYPQYYSQDPNNLPLGQLRRQYVIDQVKAIP